MTPDPAPSHSHRPGSGRPVPVSTYRLQLHGGFTFDDAAGITAYLAELGVTHLYLSPILQAVPGSTHGYDVLDHARIDADRGGREGLDRLVQAAREHGLGLIVDVVPNHMAVPNPLHRNGPLWSLLREGRHSPYAAWFDVDWDVEDDRILMPVLGEPLADLLASDALSVAPDGGPAGTEWVIRHGDQEFPIRPGTETLPLDELVRSQAYRLSWWRAAASSLNYRRFFDVTSLVAIRVEDPVVFTASHAVLTSLVAHGEVDGLRIDHPDGLADPGGYLQLLADATGEAWVVVEKILEGDEELVPEWATAGTTGYDALLRIQQVLTDPTGFPILDRLWAARGADNVDLETVTVAAKRLVLDDVQSAEVDRLMRLVQHIVPGEDQASLRRGLEALLVAMDRYRAYLVPDEVGPPAEYAVLERAEKRATELVAEADRPAVATIAQLARGARVPGSPVEARDPVGEFMIRFQQTCGPVMAKGVEDTTFYRWLRMVGANEVGGDPGQLSLAAADFHAFARHRLATWPVAMTALTTHDTKRSEDVRARLMTLVSDAVGWQAWLRDLEESLDHPKAPDPATRYLLWQTLIGTWPIGGDRLEGYLLKAIREAKLHTAWVDGDPDYEQAVISFARAAIADPGVIDRIERWLDRHAGSIRTNVLSQKLIQLTMPGVPDVYQGAELVTLTLVDPDNRGPVDYRERMGRLADLDSGAAPGDLDDEKLLVTSRALRLRRDHPEWFIGESARYTAMDVPDGVLAFTRGDDEGPGVIVVATLWGVDEPHPGELDLPPGRWRSLITEATHLGGTALPICEVLGALPVALLVAES